MSTNPAGRLAAPCRRRRLESRGAALLAVVFLLGPAGGSSAADLVLPPVSEGDFVLRDFRFRSGETLSTLKLHYATMGRPERDAAGVVRNAILVLHGTGGSCRQFLSPAFAGELFGEGQLLDSHRYFIVFPDGIGHGQSSKPSDGLRARFPRYTYDDMVEAQHRLLNAWSASTAYSGKRISVGSSLCLPLPMQWARGNSCVVATPSPEQPSSSRSVCLSAVQRRSRPQAAGAGASGSCRPGNRGRRP